MARGNCARCRDGADGKVGRWPGTAAASTVTTTCRYRGYLVSASSKRVFMLSASDRSLPPPRCGLSPTHCYGRIIWSKFLRSPLRPVPKDSSARTAASSCASATLTAHRIDRRKLDLGAEVGIVYEVKAKSGGVLNVDHAALIREIFAKRQFALRLIEISDVDELFLRQVGGGEKLCATCVRR